MRSGFLDAGSATRIAVDHLVEADPGRVVASFDIDAFYDYRARRPLMTFHESAYRDYDAPRLVVRLCHDQREHPYLLMHGPEPDTHWEAFATGVRAVIERLDVSLVMGMGAVPMAVPHTRPIMLTNHATDPDLLTVENMWKGEIRIPASAASMLELRLGEWGHDAMGFVAHVPHYVANLDYPEASCGCWNRSPRSPACPGSWPPTGTSHFGCGADRWPDGRLRRGPRCRRRLGAAVRRLPYRR